VDYGRIPNDIWSEFVEQKNSAEAKALSAQMVEKALENDKNPHHMGSGEYAPRSLNGGKKKKKNVSLLVYQTRWRARMSVAGTGP
jgi:hypothetical protein